jgi:dienelactone hydrolase
VTVAELATGAHIRVRGATRGPVVLTINGGTARDAPGTWSASTEYLCAHLARARPDLGFAETRYRIRSWRRHEMCIADGAAALDHVARAGASEVVLLGFSLGGAVSTQIAGHPLVRTVIGLAPWLPEALPVDAMSGRALHVLHGTLDPIPGTPGVSRTSSRAGFARIIDVGATGTYDTIAGGLHAIAVRAPWGGVIPTPAAPLWRREVLRLLDEAVPDARDGAPAG